MTRIGASLIIKGQRAVQSYGWTLLRPFGKIQTILSFLDEYECDEIAIMRYSRSDDNMNNFLGDIDALAGCIVNSPVSFGGGIRSIVELDQLRRIPVERIIFSSAGICNETNLLNQACQTWGKQAMQCLLPIKLTDDGIKVFISKENNLVDLETINFEMIDSLFNEVIIYDIDADGLADKFNFSILDKMPLAPQKLVITGGVGLETIKTAKSLGLASVLVDNCVLHAQGSIRRYKKNANL